MEEEEEEEERADRVGMASLCSRRSLSLFASSRLFHHRHSHTSTLWERLLGQKYEPSLSKALNDAVSQYKASQSVPSWLPFLPNSSFWVPSSEEAARSLEDLADRLNDSDGDSDSESEIGLSSTDCNPDSQSFSRGNLTFDDDVDEEEEEDEGDASDEAVPKSTALTAFQITDKLLDIHRQSPIEQGTTIVLVDLLGDVKDDNSMDGDTDEDSDEDTTEMLVIDVAKG